MKKVLGILGITALVGLCVYIMCQIDNVRYEEEHVKAVIIEKEYEPSRTYTTMMMAGKSVVPMVHTVPAEYDVIVKFENLTEEIDSQELYEALEVGDSINMIHVKRYSKDSNEYLGDSIRQP